MLYNCTEETTLPTLRNLLLTLMTKLYQEKYRPGIRSFWVWLRWCLVRGCKVLLLFVDKLFVIILKLCMTPRPVDNSNSFMFTQNLMFLLTDNMLFPSRPHICPPYRWASILPGPSAQCSCSAPLGWWRTPVSTMCSPVFIAGMDVWII